MIVADEFEELLCVLLDELEELFCGLLDELEELLCGLLDELEELLVLSEDEPLFGVFPNGSPSGSLSLGIAYADICDDIPELSEVSSYLTVRSLQPASKQQARSRANVFFIRPSFRIGLFLYYIRKIVFGQVLLEKVYTSASNQRVRSVAVYNANLQAVRKADDRHGAAAYRAGFHTDKIGAVGGGNHDRAVLYRNSIVPVITFGPFAQPHDLRGARGQSQQR